MAWIEAHQAVCHHGKTSALAATLRIPRAQAVGHLIMLWWWAMDSCGRKGSLARYSVAAIAAGSGCDGKRGPVDFFRAMVAAGWIDFSGPIPADHDVAVGGDARVHDWQNYSGRYFDTEDRKLEKRELSRRRVKRFRNALHRVTVTRCNAATVPDRTVPDQTVPTKEKEHTVAPGVPEPKPHPKTKASYRIETPEQRLMCAYKILKGVGAEDRDWDKEQWPKRVRGMQKLLKAFRGDSDAAIDFLSERSSALDKKSLSWTIETIASQAWEDAGVADFRRNYDERDQDGAKLGNQDALAAAEGPGAGPGESVAGARVGGVDEASEPF